jgi:hypothetical protein
LLSNPVSNVTFFDELRFQHHLAELVDAAIDIVIAVDNTVDPDPRSDFKHTGTALHFQVLDQRCAIALEEVIAIGVPDPGPLPGITVTSRVLPFVAAFGANQQVSVFAGKSGLALGTGGKVLMDDFLKLVLQKCGELLQAQRPDQPGKFVHIVAGDGVIVVARENE